MVYFQDGTRDDIKTPEPAKPAPGLSLSSGAQVMNDRHHYSRWGALYTSTPDRRLFFAVFGPGRAMGAGRIMGDRLHLSLAFLLAFANPVAAFTFTFASNISFGH